MFVRPGTKFPVHLKPKDFTPEVDSLNEMMRRTPSKTHGLRVGGHAQMTIIARDGITQKMLAEYPDAIGQPLGAPPALDWKRWRDAAEFRHKLTTSSHRQGKIA